MSMVDGTMQPSGPAKLDPSTLTAEERALFDAEINRTIAKAGPAVVHDLSVRNAWNAIRPAILARRALFAPATEKVEFHIPIAFGEAVCPNFEQQTAEQNEHSDPWGEGFLKWAREPAQPEPAKVCPNCVEPATVTHASANCDTGFVCKRKQPAQPAAVGMSGALERVLDCAEMDANRDRMGGHETTADRTMAAIREVRQQAAQGKPKVELPKVPVFEIRWASQFLRTGTNHPTALKNGYADAIDAWLVELDAAEGKK